MGYKKTLSKEELAEKREEQQQQLKEITETLEKGVRNVYTSDEYRNFLNMVAKFPRYSVNNNILIMMQRPDASMCQSFTSWKSMGRYVKKGEEGIKILAPAPYKIKREVEKRDEHGNLVYNADGEVEKVVEEHVIPSFKVVTTFDVSQTEGKELPSLGVNELVGDVDGYENLMNILKEICPVSISFEKIDGPAKGYFSHTENRIVVREGMSQLQSLKTLLHEMAHQRLHSKEVPGHDKSRMQKEVEAESVAYSICQRYGIDTSDYSFTYVATWSQDKELPELKASLETIRQAAADMITEIDEKLDLLLPDKNKEVEQPAIDPNYLANITREEASQMSCQKIYEHLQVYQSNGDMSLLPKVKENARSCSSQRVRCILNELEVKQAADRVKHTPSQKKSKGMDI